MTCARSCIVPKDLSRLPASVQRPAACARRGHSVTTLMVVLVAIAFVAVPVCLGELPREIARWYAAAAAESSLNEDYVAAVAHMDQAIAWNGEDPVFYLERASYKLETQQWESGLEDCDQARKLVPDSSAINLVRSEFLQHLGRPEAAIEEFKELLRRGAGASPGVRAELLNSLAYVRAVGKRELREALEASEESLQIVMIPSAVLDPAGYLCYARGYTAMRQDDTELALESLNEAVQHADSAYRQSVARLESLSNVPRGSQEYQERAAALRPHLLGILTLRAQLFDQLERPDEAAKDRVEIESLTPHGNRTMEEPIELSMAFQRVRDIGNCLDTRGYINYQLGDLPAARRDMQRAVDICQWSCTAQPWVTDAEKHQIMDIRERQKDEHRCERSLAVVYYHQMLVHEALGKQEQAAQDRARVVELGYEPDEHLF